MKDVALSTSVEAINANAQIVDSLEEKVFEDFQIIDRQFLGEKEKYERALAVFTEWKPIRDEVIALMLKGKKEQAANITRGKGARHVVKIEEAMHSLGDFAQFKAREFLYETHHIKELTFNSMYFVIGIALIIGIASALLVTKSITAPLVYFTRATRKSGEGKLDTKVDIRSKDEIGNLAVSFNNMTSNLSEVTTSRDKLNIEVNERMKAEAELNQALVDKDFLMKEVHHRVKNNLAVIQSLLKLQLNEITDDKSKRLFIDAESRVTSMAMIHEMLHNADDIKKLGASEYIRKLIQTLFHNYKIQENHVKLVYEVQDINLDVDTLIPLALIINELVSNALKYAFPGDMKGELGISLKATSDASYELIIKDNGVGLPEGFELNKTKSLGYLIVKSLINQIKGTLEVSNRDGAEFKVDFTERLVK
jgi:two-component sensor histidine kinase/HAMP domain-containing protein